MKPETLTALKESIKHWERNAFGPIGKASDAMRDCALCGIYFNSNCEECPVRENTGRRSCHGTPYSKASRALDRWQSSDGVKAEEDAFREAAKAELEFLKSLLPEGEA